MRNIVIITGGFSLPDKNASAIRALALARTLKIIGYKPIVAGFVKGGQNKDCNWCENDGVQCFNRHDADRIATDISYINVIENQYSVSDIYAIIAYNYPGIALNRLRRYTNQHGIKMVVDITEWYGWELDERKLLDAIQRKFYTEYRMRVLNRMIGNIICTTNYIADYYLGYNTMVLPAIDDRSFSVDIKSVQKNVNKPRKFIYAGAPEYKFRKDKINIVVQMFELLCSEGVPFHFDVYGVEEDYYNAFFHKPRVNEGEIVFHGTVSREEVMKLLPTYDFYVLLRPNNRVCKVGFSSKSMESISSGVPVIANDVNGDFSKYFTQNQALLCDAEDMDAFYSLLKKACTMTDDEIVSMKESCVKNNPFDYKNYIEPLSLFMKGLK